MNCLMFVRANIHSLCIYTYMQRTLASFCHKPSRDLKPHLYAFRWSRGIFDSTHPFGSAFSFRTPCTGWYPCWARLWFVYVCSFHVLRHLCMENTLMCSILMSEDIEDVWWNMIQMMEPFVLGLWNGWQWPVLLWFRPMISQRRQSRQIAPVQSNFMVKTDAVL